MSARRSLVVGLAGSVWAALIGLAVVPLYLRYLGIEAYGLIGAFATLQVVVQLLDVGLAATMNREVARHLEAGSLAPLGSLFRTLSVVYWSTAAVLASAVAGIGPLVASDWLSAQQLPEKTLAASVMLLGLVIAARWPIGLYQGVLMGAHRLATVSLVGAGMVTLGSVGAVIVLACVSASLEAFFAWQAGVGLLHALTMRTLARRVIAPGAAARFDASELRRVWSFTAGMSGVAITGTLLLQADKVILSRLLPLGAFGQYMLATVVAGGLYLVLGPTFNLIYPRLSALVLRPVDELVRYYRRGTRLLAAALFPIATVAVVFAHDIVALWTGNRVLADAAAPLVQWCLLGTTLNGIMHFPHALQLAFGQTRRAVLMNVALVALMLPMTVLLATRWGSLGGAMSWALLNVVYFFLGAFLIHGSLLPGIGVRWIAIDVGVPLAATVAILGTACVALSRLALARPLLLACAFFLAGLFCLLLMRAGARLEKYTGLAT